MAVGLHLPSSRLRKNCFAPFEVGELKHPGRQRDVPAGCSKRPDFSPAQPWRVETRLPPSKAAASEEARRTLRYVEPLSDARTKLADFFSILLVKLEAVVRKGASAMVLASM